LLSDVIKSAKDASPPVALLVVVDDYFRTCTINYHGGAGYHTWSLMVSARTISTS